MDYLAGSNFFWKAIDSVRPSCKFELKILLLREMAAFFICFLIFCRNYVGVSRKFVITAHLSKQ